MGGVLRSAAGLLAVAMLFAGCSTGEFKQPISEFSKATAAAATSFESYANSLDKTARDQNLEDVSQGRATVRVVNCDRGQPCEVSVLRGQAALALSPALLSNTRKLVASVVVYAKNLEAIASGDDVAAIKTAGDAIPGAIANAAKAADALNAQLGHRTNLSAETGIFTPIADIIVIGLTKYAEMKKLEALRNSTAVMENVFPRIVDTLAEAANTDFKIKLNALYVQRTEAGRNTQRAVQKNRQEIEAHETESRNKFPRANPDTHEKARDELDEAFKPKRIALQKGIKDALDALDSANVAYNTAVTAKPASVFTKLGETHTALVKALQMPEPDFRRVFALLQQLADTASALAKDTKAIDEALHPKTKA
jgi:hypothetical protein